MSAACGTPRTDRIPSATASGPPSSATPIAPADPNLGTIAQLKTQVAPFVAKLDAIVKSARSAPKPTHRPKLEELVAFDLAAVSKKQGSTPEELAKKSFVTRVVDIDRLEAALAGKPMVPHHFLLTSVNAAGEPDGAWIQGAEIARGGSPSDCEKPSHQVLCLRALQSMPKAIILVVPRTVREPADSGDGGTFVGIAIAYDFATGTNLGGDAFSATAPETYLYRGSGETAMLEGRREAFWNAVDGAIADAIVGGSK